MKHAVYFQTPITLSALAKLIGGAPYGDPETVIRGVASSEEPMPGCIVFVKGKNATRKIDALRKTARENHDQGIAVLAVENSRYVTKFDSQNAIPCILLSNTTLAITAILEYAAQQVPVKKKSGIHASCFVHESARIDPSVYVGPNSVIEANVTILAGSSLVGNVFVGEDVHIGQNTLIHSHVSIRERSVVGNNVTIHNNSVIGADGFGYASGATGIVKVPQLGVVEIEDSVEIGALSAIDRATVGTTRIGFGTKIDNQVQIGHNVHVGRFCILCACTKIGGSSVLGDGVVCGGGTGIADHMTLVSGVRLGGAAQVVTDLLEPGDYAGSPAAKASQYRRALVSRRKEVNE